MMNLDPVKLEVLSLRRDKLEERIAWMRAALDGGSMPVAPLVTDGFGKLDAARLDALVEELTATWGLHAFYREGWDWDQALAEGEAADGDAIRDGYSYVTAADPAPARDFLSCALALVGSCPWFFEGTIAEVKALAANIGPVTAGVEPDAPFSLAADVYSEVDPAATFFESMDVLALLLTGEEVLPEEQAPSSEDDDAREALAEILSELHSAGELDETDEARWDDTQATGRWLEEIAAQSAAWRESLAGMPDLLERYTAFREACLADGGFLATFSDDVTFAFDALLADRGVSHMLDDDDYFTTYHYLREAQLRLEGGRG